jgi:spermidine synthase
MHFAVVISLSAFLIFLVQPLIAKQILPWFGGSAAVWTTCMVFFQTALLAGYAYADWAPRQLGVRRQARVHVALALVSLAALPIVVQSVWKPVDGSYPILRILGLLTATIGLPYFVLSATSPLVQTWFARARPGRDPYRLFALSNTASLAALLSYPFLIEPQLLLRMQAIVWSALYALFVVAMGWLGWRIARSDAAPGTPFAARRVPDAHPDVRDAIASPSDTGTAGAANDARASGDTVDIGTHGLPPGAWLWWLVLAATASALLLAVTNQLTENIASVPLLWLLPLSVYLVTFILCFDGQRWYSRETYFGPVLIAIAAMGWMLVDKAHQFDLPAQAVVFGLGLFVVCMFCHGELVAAKPAPRFLARFYSIVALGGALGSALVAIGAPLALPSYYETGCVLVVAAALLAVVGRGWSRRALVLGVLAWFMGLGIVALQVRNDDQDTVWMGRDFYGALKVREYEKPDSDNYHRRLVHGAILHGEQYQAPWARKFATTYYTGSSGIGRAIDVKENEKLAIRVGMIGLGVGTIATYGRKDDVFRFYEIDPQVPVIARKYFTFLGDSEARVDVVLGDARLSIEREPPQEYDVLAVDAFSGDAIPAHLITREAIALFRRHLAPGGILAYHVSNRYLDLAPVVGRIAEEEKLTALQIDDYKGINDTNPIKSPSVWVLLAAEPATLEPLKAFGREPEARPAWRTWSDDYHNLFQVLRAWNAG